MEWCVKNTDKQMSSHISGLKIHLEFLHHVMESSVLATNLQNNLVFKMKCQFITHIIFNQQFAQSYAYMIDISKHSTFSISINQLFIYTRCIALHLADLLYQ